MDCVQVYEACLSCQKNSGMSTIPGGNSPLEETPSARNVFGLKVMPLISQAGVLGGGGGGGDTGGGMVMRHAIEEAHFETKKILTP